MATILETDENGALVLPARVLGHEAAHARYILEARGETLLLRPEVETAKPKKATVRKQQSHEEWMKEWRELGEQIGKTWPEGPSALEVLTEMRNARGQGDVSDY